VTPATAARYWHTLRHLKLGQVTGRLRMRLLRPSLDSRAAALASRARTGDWVTPPARQASMTGPDSFRFLNHDATAPGWNDPAQEKLWLYNLHYFDDLNAQGAAQRGDWHRDLLARWIAQNPPTAGTGWEPYPTSLRIVNWVKWALAGNLMPTTVQASLALQARWLMQRLEWHLLGNHLFANAKALVLAGLFLEGAEAKTWLAKGLAIVARQLPEQVLSDGGNFERSPMYHAIFLEDVLDLINAAQAFGQVPAATVHGWRETAIRMLDFMAGLTHPDGGIALFNDAAFGIAPTPHDLADYAARLGIVAPCGSDRLRHWSDSGYIRLENDAAVALLDVAPVGPDYLPGHAHADTLSFELSLRGRRVIVNGGTSRYGADAERQRERATAWHSTVEVAGADSSEVWGGFRVARRAYPFDLKKHSENNILEVDCSHDGYCRLPGRPVHRRVWRLSPGSLTVRDHVSGGAPALARFILHPGLALHADGAVWRILDGDALVATATVTQGQGNVRDAQYAPEFGQRFATRCLAVALTKGQSAVTFDWSMA